jgi:hypothetical protein
MTRPMTAPWTAFKFSDEETWDNRADALIATSCWWVDGPQWVFVDEDDFFMTEEDARLIAAAPELLHALEKAVPLLAGDDRSGLLSMDRHVWLHEARAVLAKARMARRGPAASGGTRPGCGGRPHIGEGPRIGDGQRR